MKNRCSSPKLASFDKLVSESLNETINLMVTNKDNPGAHEYYQHIIQEELIQKGTCRSINPEIVDDIRLKIFNIDDVKLQDLFDSSMSVNSNFQAEIACTVDAIIYDNSSITIKEKMRNWLHGIKQIGINSTDGYALSASLSNDTNLFILKAPLTTEPNIDLTHDIFIGFFALNNMKKIVPNFMYVYGYTKCSRPITSKGEVLTWCSPSNDSVNYMITENITNSVTLDDFINRNDINDVDLLTVILQIFNALNLAYKSYQYTHYDLHTKNVLVKTYPEAISIPFYINNKVIGYIVTKYVAYIIDYGYNSITINNIPFGITIDKVNIHPGPFPMYDVYKILGFIAQNLLNTRNYRFLNIIDALFIFFNEGSIIDQVNNVNNKFYVADIKYKNITYEEYLQWLVSNFKLPIYANIANPIDFNTKLDNCEFTKLIDNPLGGPRTALEYYQLKSINKEISHNFKAGDHLIEIYPEFIELYNHVRRLLPEALIPNVNNLNIKDYTNRIRMLVRLKSLVENLVMVYNYNVKILREEGLLSQYTNITKDLHVKITELRNNITYNIRKLGDNYNQLNMIPDLRDGEWINYIYNIIKRM